jgi:hypothetical protein
MKHLAAYLLLGLGGNTSPSAADVKVRDLPKPLYTIV